MNKEKLTKMLEYSGLLAYRISRMIGIILIAIYLLVGTIQFFTNDYTVIQNINDLYYGLLFIMVGHLGIERRKLEIRLEIRTKVLEQTIKRLTEVGDIVGGQTRHEINNYLDVVETLERIEKYETQ